MAAALEFRNVSVASGSYMRLANVSLALEHGTATAILGRSGSGKTTLLRTANRLVCPNEGCIYFEGKEVSNGDLIELRRKMGYIIQETGLFPHLTIERNVAILLEVDGERREQRRSRANELLRLVGLEPNLFSQRFPHQLSGGQRQRVGLARALAGNPRVLLMDEPFGALDPLTRAEMQDTIRNLLKQVRTTVLLVTHDLDEALYLAQRIVLLDNGSIVADLMSGEFLRSSNPKVIAYAQAYRRGDSGGYSDVHHRSDE